MFGSTYQYLQTGVFIMKRIKSALRLFYELEQQIKTPILKKNKSLA